jgi:nicotinamidase-related amidase
MSYPSLYSPKDAFASPYTPRIAEFTNEGRRAGLRPSALDRGAKNCLIVVDAQVDFVDPKGALAVPGAQADSGRTAEFIYSHAEHISDIYASLDSHLPFQIFYSGWWQYLDDGSHPLPFTMISINTKGELTDDNGRLVQAVLEPVWSYNYVLSLQKNAKKSLMIWPYHTMIGTPGHAMVSVISEAMAWHAAARNSQPNFIVKGTVPQTEHYGIFHPEVLYPKSAHGGVNTFILDAVANYHRIYVVGQAKSHCVLETMKQLVAYFKNQPEVLRRIIFLEDCTSSVVHDKVDFEAIAVASLADMAKLGIQIRKSTDAA